MRKLLLLLLLGIGPAQAQNTTCATRLAGDSSNACSSTSFAQQLLSGGFATPEAQNLFFSGPASGAAAAPTFRAIVPLDLAPALLIPPPIGTTTPNLVSATAFSTTSAVSVGTSLSVGTTATVTTSLSVPIVSGPANSLAITSSDGATVFGIFDASGLSVSQVVYGISGLKTSPITVSNLATCNSTNMGLRAFVTDQSTTIAYHGPVVSGGSFKQGVICDGTNWYQD